jgi:hypothetical protein
MRRSWLVWLAAAGLTGGLPACAQATITVGSSVTATTTKTTMAISKPSGTASGQVMVASVSWASSAAMTPPSGWTLVADTSAAAGSVRQATYVKVAGASEPTSYTFTWSTRPNASGGITTYSGVNATVPVDASADATGASGNPVAPAVTTSSANDRVIVAAASDAVTSFTTASGTTERFDIASGSSTQELADFAQATAGATTAKTQVPAVTTGSWTAQTIALRDASTAGLSVSTGATASFTANLDAGDANPAYSIPITVLDTRTGASAGLGWNLTITSKTLTTGTRSLATDATQVDDATGTCANGGVCVAPSNSTTYPVPVPAGPAVPAAVKFASIDAGTGEGAFSIPAQLDVTVPQNSFAGSYTSTVTVSVVSGP